MKKNKKLVILSSSLAGLGLAAGALAVSCNNEKPVLTQENVNAEAQTVEIRVKQGVTLSFLQTAKPQDFHVVKKDGSELDTELYNYDVVGVETTNDEANHQLTLKVTAKVSAKANPALSSEVESQTYSESTLSDDEKEQQRQRELQEQIKQNLNSLAAPSFTYANKENIYLPTTSTLSKDQVQVELGDLTTDVRYVKVISVEPKADNATTAVVKYQLQSLENVQVFSDEKTAEITGFKSVEEHNKSELARLEEVAKAVSVDYENKADIIASAAVSTGVQVNLPENTVNVQVKENSAQVLDHSVENKSIHVGFTLVSTDPNYPGVEFAVSGLVVEGFKELSQYNKDTLNYLENIVKSLVFNGIKQTKAENETKSDAELALAAYKKDPKAAIIKAGYKTADGELPSDVKLTYKNVWGVSTHPNALLIEYTLSKSNGTDNEVSTSAKYTIYNFGQDKKGQEETENVYDELVKEKDAIQLTANQNLALNNDDAKNSYLVDKSLKNVTQKQWILPSEFKKEVLAEIEAAKKDYNSKNKGEDEVAALNSFFDKNKDKIFFFKELKAGNYENWVVTSIQFGNDEAIDANGVLTGTVVLKPNFNEKTSPKKAKYNDDATLVKSIEFKIAGFMSTPIKQHIQKVIVEKLNAIYVAPENSDSVGAAISFTSKGKNRGVAVSENAIDLIPLTNVEVFSNPEEAQKLFNKFSAKNGFVASQSDSDNNAVATQLAKDSTTRSTELITSVIDLLINDPTKLDIAKEDNTTEKKTLKDFLGLEARKEKLIEGAFLDFDVVRSLKSSVGTTTARIDTATTVTIPGLGKYSASIPTQNNISGFLTSENEEELKLQWKITAQKFITQAMQAKYPIRYNKKNDNVNDNELTVITDVTENDANLKYFKYWYGKKASDTVYSTKEVDLAKEGIVLPEKFYTTDTDQGTDIFADKAGKKEVAYEKYRNYAMKLVVLKASSEGVAENQLNLTYKLVNPYHPTWEFSGDDSAQTRTIQISFISVKQNEINKVNKLKEIINANFDKLVNLDYTNKEAISAFKAGEKYNNQKANNQLHPEIVYSFKDGVTLADYIRDENGDYKQGFDIFTENEEKQPLSNWAELSLRSFISKQTTEEGDAYQEGTTGSAGVVLTVNTKKGKEVASDGSTSADLSEQLISGFQLSNSQEKQRLNKLRGQFAFLNYASTTSDLQAVTEQERTELEKELAKIWIDDARVAEKANYSFIANYNNEKENALAVIDSVELPSANTSNSVTIKYHFESKTNAGTKSDIKSFTFVGFGTKQQHVLADKKAELTAELNRLAFNYAITDANAQNAATKVTPAKLAEQQDETQNHSLYTPSNRTENLSYEYVIKSVTPYGENGQDAKDYNRVKLSVVLKTTVDGQAVETDAKDIIVGTFLTAAKEEENRLKAVNNITADIKAASFSKGEFLPDLAEVAKIWGNLKNEQASPIEFSNLTESNAKVVWGDKNFKLVANNKEGKISATFKVQSTKDRLESVVVEKKVDITGFLTQEQYDTKFNTERTRLNELATKLHNLGADGQSAISWTRDEGKDPQVSLSQLLNDRGTNELWNYFEISGNLVTEAKLQVIAVTKGVKETDVIVTFRLISEKEGMKQYTVQKEADNTAEQDLSRFAGVESDIMTAKATVMNLLTDEQFAKNFELNQKLQKLALTTTSKDWNGNAEYNQLLDFAPVKAYNATFDKVTDAALLKVPSVLDTLVSQEENKYGALTLPESNNNNKNASTFTIVKDGKDVKVSTTLAREVTGLRINNEFYEVSEFTNLTELITGDLLGNSDTDTLYAKIVLKDKDSDVKSKEILVKISGFLTPSQHHAKEIQEVAKQAKLVDTIERLAKISNVRLTSKYNGSTVVENFDESWATTESKWAELYELYIPAAGESTADETSLWSKDRNNGKALALNVAAEVEKLTDKAKKDALVESGMDITGSQVPFMNDGVHLTANNDNEKYRVNFVINSVKPEGEKLVISYTVTAYDYVVENKVAKLKEIYTAKSATVIEKGELPTFANKERKDEMLKALQSASTTFDSPSKTMTASEFVAKYNNEKTTKEEKEQLLTYTLANPDFALEIVNVTDDSSVYIGRVMIEYRIKYNGSEKMFDSTEFKQTQTKIGFINGFAYDSTKVTN
ncbi:hypothetical protein C4M96_02940 [Mycoplasmopsis pullorum]|uniref:hypothetical protein n=2 Tax=Mycoplasmopsis pullorum TaxID=48003 RepID=UPI00111A5483|nr:hypothetical protein [Mycoplasmopsis pullorum]TNK91914.1 hypothetical protein C4M96_02940 [Mycoplasmopsis pullorum]